MIVIGLGSGRCGTVSLSKLLGSLRGANITHEQRPLLPWKFDREILKKKIEIFKQREGQIVGDVAHPYINYVEALMREFYNIKFVVLKRDREQTAQSFIRKTSPGSRPPKPHFASDNTYIFDKCFPLWPHLETTEAYRKYWDLYYSKIKELETKYPEKIKTFHTTALNKRETIDQIYDFLEIPKQERVYKIFKENKTRV